MEPIVLPKSSNLLKLPEQLYGTIKRVGILNKEPILYGDVNLLKPNDLYYINGAKQIYRYVKSSIEDDSMTYYFDTIKSIATDNLAIPEEERGKIRNAGYLFNEIIYSGDPNLVENGSLFYHDTLPYISIVSDVDGTINLSTKEIDEEGEITTVVTEYRVSPEPHDYVNDYLTFRALEDTAFTLTIPSQVDTNYLTSVSYSTDNGSTWVTTQNDATEKVITTPSITTGNTILWKGSGISTSITGNSPYVSKFSSTGAFDIEGNIMSMLYGDNFANQTTLPSNSTNFRNLFSRSDIVDASNLKLPATTLTVDCYRGMLGGCTSLTTMPDLPATTLGDSCYLYMFSGCSALTTIPKTLLPATTLADNCYSSMFQGCTSLTTAPELPATTLTGSCYQYMFKDCTSLTTAPELPATTLASYCYRYMFNGCTSLTTAPELPATTLAYNCYFSMFTDCSNLNYIKAMFTTTPSTSYTSNWVSGVASTGTFVKNSAATWNVTGVNGIPTGWTVETANADTNEITI